MERARSARSGRLRGLIASDLSVKVAGQSVLKVPDVETGRLLRDDRGWAPVGGLEDGGLTELFDGIVFAYLTRARQLRRAQLDSSRVTRSGRAARVEGQQRELSGSEV